MHLFLRRRRPYTTRRYVLPHHRPCLPSHPLNLVSRHPYHNNLLTLSHNRMQDMQDIKPGSRGDMRDLASSSEDTMPPRQPGTEDHPRPEVRRRSSFNGEGSVSLFEILQQRAGHLTPSIAAAMQRSREVQAKPLLITAREPEGCKSFFWSALS